jgi:hypothetical protein
MSTAPRHQFMLLTYMLVVNTHGSRIFWPFRKKTFYDTLKNVEWHPLILKIHLSH